jgi:SAM-dependent methyltransferase
LQDAISSGKLAERFSTKARQIIAPLRPYRLLTALWARRARMVTEAFYEQILKPNETSRIWAKRYLAGLDLPTEFNALEVGCGRGANLCHLRNVGAVISGHDIAPQTWWSKLQSARLQVILPHHRFLPWSSGVFDLVLIMQVAGFFEESSYQVLAREIHRVLRPGGYVVMQETNPNSYAIAHHRNYYGRMPHSLDTGRGVFSTGFEEIDHWYEGFYARHFPMLNNVRRAARHTAPGPWMINDGSDAVLPAEKRVLWVLRARKLQDS